jgi:hypothetical protein
MWPSSACILPFRLWCYMQCAICGTLIQTPYDRVVATCDGLVVHIACADHEATIAWAYRRRHALVEGGLLLGVTSGLWYVLGLVFGVLALAAGCALHLLRHWRWWQRLAFSARRTLSMKG